MPPDHLPDVVRRDLQVKDDGILAVLRLDPDRFGIVDELPRQPLEKLSHSRR